MLLSCCNCRKGRPDGAKNKTKKGPRLEEALLRQLEAAVNGAPAAGTVALGGYLKHYGKNAGTFVCYGPSSFWNNESVQQALKELLKGTFVECSERGYRFYLRGRHAPWLVGRSVVSNRIEIIVCDRCFITRTGADLARGSRTA